MYPMIEHLISLAQTYPHRIPMPQSIKEEMHYYQLGKIINQRIGLVSDLVLIKWQKHLPIEDLDREQYLLNELEEIAVVMGFKKKAVTELFEEIFTLSKSVQRKVWIVLEKTEACHLNLRCSNEQILRSKIHALGLDLMEELKRIKQDQKWSLRRSNRRSAFLSGLSTCDVCRDRKLHLFGLISNIT